MSTPQQTPALQQCSKRRPPLLLGVSPLTTMNPAEPCGRRSPSPERAAVAAAGAEMTRTRWTPKPEQVLILESIFNSGMVNPPKDETVRIRKLLEKFGAVGDANVFYWFQNRRSRSRRRLRQMQAAAAADSGTAPTEPNSSASCSSPPAIAACGGGSSSSSSVGEEDLFAISRQMGLVGGSQVAFGCDLDASQLHYQPGTNITVVINGVALEVPQGPIDMKAMFGPDAFLVHSNGQILCTNEHGILLHSLQMGESYFLVSRPT